MIGWPKQQTWTFNEVYTYAGFVYFILYFIGRHLTWRSFIIIPWSLWQVQDDPGSGKLRETKRERECKSRVKAPDKELGPTREWSREYFAEKATVNFVQPSSKPISSKKEKDRTKENYAQMSYCSPAPLPSTSHTFKWNDSLSFLLSQRKDPFCIPSRKVNIVPIHLKLVTNSFQSLHVNSFISLYQRIFLLFKKVNRIH